MSGHGHDDADGDHGSHDLHEPETTSDDFPDDEPRSPGWLPLLGGALFLAAIFVLVVFGGESGSGETGGGNPPAAAASGNRFDPAGRPALQVPSAD